MGDFAQDLRYAFRVLAANRGFTLAAVVSLAIGIGANTAIFSVVHSVLISPLPFQDSPRLAFLETYWNPEEKSAGSPPIRRTA